MAKKEDIEFFECSAKYDFNIKKMFYNSIAELPIFNGSNRKTLVKELIKENEEIYDENELQNLLNLNDSNEEEDKSIEELEENEEEKNNDYCSMDEHKEIKALIYCQECQRNMCKSCEQYHSNFLKGHHTYSLDKNKNEIFTGLCTNKKHSLELEFYCKTHNQLCCAACISKIKSNGKGQHKNCEVYCLTKIKLIKKENLEENINHLEELSNKLEPTIKELNSIFDKINESKEKIKTDINILFNKLRNELNNREKQLYKEIDEKFGEIFFKDGFIKESKTLPNLVKISLEKGMIKEDDWNNKKNKKKQKKPRMI